MKSLCIKINGKISPIIIPCITKSQHKERIYSWIRHVYLFIQLTIRSFIQIYIWISGVLFSSCVFLYKWLNLPVTQFPHLYFSFISIKYKCTYLRVIRLILWDRIHKKCLAYFLAVSTHSSTQEILVLFTWLIYKYLNWL